MLYIEGLFKSYRHGVLPVLQGIDFDLEEGEICAIVGESGSGKSTLLKVIAGLEAPDSGIVELNGKPVSSTGLFTPPEKRNIGFVFQDFALFPHLTVFQNIAFGIARQKNRRKRVRELIRLVGLEKHASKYPNELSGGEQQRVALARALAPNPSLLLMDEPFSNLDVGIKKEIREFLFEIVRSAGVSCIFVTHDLDDAMEYADTIAILHKGVFEQKGKPQDLYTSPNSAYIARFFGDINILDPCTIELLNLSVPSNKTCAVRACDVKCSFRSDETNIPVQILHKTYLGNQSRLRVQTEKGGSLDLLLPDGLMNGQEQVYISIDPNDILLFEEY